jgi:hypothetical protein
MPKHKKKGPLSLQGAVKKQVLCMLLAQQHLQQRTADVLCCLLQLFKTGVELPLKVLHRDSAAAGRGLPAYVSVSIRS